MQLELPVLQRTMMTKQLPEGWRKGLIKSTFVHVDGWTAIEVCTVCAQGFRVLLGGEYVEFVTSLKEVN